jgi:hypothetical protein
LNSGQPASTATSRYRPIHLRRVSVLTNVRSVPLVSTPSWETYVRTAVEVLCPDQSDHRRIGKAITILARIQRAPRSNTDLLILKLMHGSRAQSSQYRQRSGNPNMSTANNTINSDVQKRRFALLLHAGYGER